MQKKAAGLLCHLFLNNYTKVSAVFLCRNGATSLKEMFSLKVPVCSKVSYTLEKVLLPQFNSI